MTILHQTSGSLSMVISLPSIPVKPKMNTIKCSSKILRVVVLFIFVVQFGYTTRNNELHQLHRFYIERNNIGAGYDKKVSGEIVGMRKIYRHHLRTKTERREIFFGDETEAVQLDAAYPHQNRLVKPAFGSNQRRHPIRHTRVNGFQQRNAFQQLFEPPAKGLRNDC